MKFYPRISRNAHVLRELDFFIGIKRLRQIPWIAGNSRISRFFIVNGGKKGGRQNEKHFNCKINIYWDYHGSVVCRLPANTEGICLQV